MRRLGHLRLFIALCLLLLAVILLALGWGSVSIPWVQVPSLFWQWASGAPLSPEGVVLWQIRLPRVLLAGLIGGVLAVVGASLQALLRNVLADPYVLGVSSGAALGAVVGGLVSQALFGISGGAGGLLFLWAFGGSLLTLLLLYRIASVHGVLPVQTLLLAGVVINAIFSALVLFAVAMVEPTRLFGLLSWLMGSIGSADYRIVGLLLIYSVVGVALLISRAEQLNLLTLGDESAKSLGVEPERLKRLVFVTTALLTGAVVSLSGMIGFVGMMVPHMVRLLIGPDHRRLLPTAALAGALFLILADLLARSLLAPAELPVGVITALCGGPFFLYILWRRHHGIVIGEGR
jgi:iron complex transport system permease protein